MTFGRWTTSGTLDWVPGEVLYAAELNETLEDTMPPIGSIIAWNKNYSGSVPSINSGWLECDGSVISDADSPFNGDTMPDLNSNKYFLSGSVGSGGTGGASEHYHTMTYNARNAEQGGGYALRTTQTSSELHLPPFYTVIWMMRIK